VSQTQPPKKDEEPKRKRLTVDLEPELHARFKIACTRRGMQMTEALRQFIEDVAKEGD
jgi:antitoxin component of RelBE/YafQ-DinJ toxin-antitoxin module